jgi:hypothetical protein
MLHTFFIATDIQSLEQIAVILSFHKKVPQHLHVQRFAKPTRATQQGNGVSFKDVPHQHGFIHVVAVVPDDFPKIGTTKR